jgi:two-component system OmpR family sensor kinase
VTEPGGGSALGGSQTRALRRAAVRLGLQTGVAVAVVVVALIGVALAVVLRSQHTAAIDLITKSVARADDVTDPPAGAWLIISTPSRLLRSHGLPAGFPDLKAVEAAAALAGESNRIPAPVTTTVQLGGREYLVATQARPGMVVQGVLDLSGDHAERDRLVGALVLSGLLGLVLAALSGAFLASRAMKPLASSLAMQRRFVADASHELRTPLTLLSTRAQLVQRGLRRGRDPVSLATDIDGLVTDADHLAMILEDLLVAADPRGDGLGESVDLRVLADQVTAACEPSARQSQVTIDIHLPEDPVMVHGAPVALRRALTALVDNAVRHASSTVVVSVDVRGARAIVEVSDDGPGIDEEVLPRLFERFETFPDGRPAPDEPAEAGRRRYGLGLALVSEVAARHGGQVRARNRSTPAHLEAGASGTGATLELSLPWDT